MGATDSSHTVCLTLNHSGIRIPGLPKLPKRINQLAQKRNAYILVINHNFDLKITSSHLLQLQGLLLTFLNVNDVLVSLRCSVKSPAPAVIVPTLCPSSDA